MKTKKYEQKLPHKKRILSSKKPLHIVLKSNLSLSIQGHHALLYVRKLLKEIESRYGVIVFQYSLERNHLHLFLLTGAACRLSDGMQYLASKLARYFNKRFSRKGSFWHDRFFSSIKHSAREIIRAIHYIANQCSWEIPFENTMSSLGKEESYPWGIPPLIISLIGAGPSVSKLREVILNGTLPYQSRLPFQKAATNFTTGQLSLSF
ncbi:MAG: transposase [Oligoflexia bacterium]|nr:transposase [Oligoflexia bacterium]